MARAANEQAYLLAERLASNGAAGSRTSSHSSSSACLHRSQPRILRGRSEARQPSCSYSQHPPHPYPAAARAVRTFHSSSKSSVWQMHATVVAKPAVQVRVGVLATRGFAASSTASGQGARRGYTSCSSLGHLRKSEPGNYAGAAGQAMRRGYVTWTKPVSAQSVEGAAASAKRAWESYSVAAYTPKLPGWVRSRLPEMPEGVCCRAPGSSSEFLVGHAQECVTNS